MNGTDPSPMAGEGGENYRLIVQSLRDYAVLMLDAQGRIQAWNRGAERIFQFGADEVVGNHFSMLYPPQEQDDNESARVLQHVAAHGHLEQRAWRVRKDGSRFWADVSITALRGPDGALYGYGKVTRDMTEQRRHDERFRRAVESAPNGMIMIDATGRIVLSNMLVDTMFGYEPGELQGQRIEVLVPDRLRAKHGGYRESFLAAPHKRAMGGGSELYARRRDGREFPVEIGLNPVESEEGTMVLASIVDISERKAAESRLETALREKTVLLNEVHHRVKNNLQLISSLLSLQSSYCRDRGVGEVLGESEGRIRAMALTHQLLYERNDFTRLDIGEYLVRLCDLLASSYGDRSDRISLNVSLPEDAIALEMDRAIPYGLLVNELVANAFKHAFPADRSGTISVAIAREATDAVLRVSDDGVGMPDSFDLETTDSLGLQLVHQLVDQVHGRIDMRCDDGTRFEIRMPMVFKR